MSGEMNFKCRRKKTVSSSKNIRDTANDSDGKNRTYLFGVKG